MKTKILLTLGAAMLAAATINLSAGTGATFLTAHNPANVMKAAPLTEVITVNYQAPATATLLTPRAAGNLPKIVVSNGAADTVMAAKCPLVGTPKNIELAGNKARMACCNMTLAGCSTVAMCGK